jgi:hypothetical protein
MGRFHHSEKSIRVSRCISAVRQISRTELEEQQAAGIEVMASPCHGSVPIIDGCELYSRSALEIWFALMNRCASVSICGQKRIFNFCHLRSLSSLRLKNSAVKSLCKFASFADLKSLRLNPPLSLFSCSTPDSVNPCEAHVRPNPFVSSFLSKICQFPNKIDILSFVSSLHSLPSKNVSPCHAGQSRAK